MIDGMMTFRPLVGLSALWFTLSGSAAAQSGAAVSGTVTLESTGQPMHAARVLLSPLGKHVDSDEQGKYEIRNVPAGSYTITASAPGVSSESRLLESRGVPKVGRQVHSGSGRPAQSFSLQPV
jgi:hypothetical protein